MPEASGDQMVTDEQVLSWKVPWEQCAEGGILAKQHSEILKSLAGMDAENKIEVLVKDKKNVVAAFFSVLRNVQKLDVLQHTLAQLYSLINDNPEVTQHLHISDSTVDELPYPALLRIISNSSDQYCIHRACYIMVQLLATRPNATTASSAEYVESVTKDTPSKIVDDVKKRAPVLTPHDQACEEALTQLIKWCVQQLKRPSHPKLSMPLAANVLNRLLSERGARVIFYKCSGVPLLAPLLKVTTSGLHIQQAYDTCCAVWKLSFYQTALQAITATDGILNGIIQVLKGVTKEKVTRVGLMCVCNILTYSNEKKLGIKLMEWGLPKIIQIFSMQQWTDTDIPEMLEQLTEIMSTQMEQVSSFDQYKREVLDGTLAFSPMHTSQSFWKQNCDKFSEKDWQVLRVLLRLLESSGDATTLAVVCNDVACFVQAHPTGRGIVNDLGFKTRVLPLLEHNDKTVQKYALKAVQQLMLSKTKLEFMQGQV